MCSLAGLSHLLSEPLWPLLSPLPATGHCICPAQQRACPRGQASKGGGHGVHLAPTCNRGALVFVSCSLARAPQMSGVARLFPCPSSLHGRVQPGLAPSPLGREEGSARAQAPPQLRTRPWPGHEHLALPGERASRALCSREQPPPPQALGPKPVPQLTDRQRWASPPGTATGAARLLAAMLTGFLSGWGRALWTPPRASLATCPTAQVHQVARGLLGHSLQTQVSFPACTRVETSPPYPARSSLSPSLLSSNVETRPCRA